VPFAITAAIWCIPAVRGTDHRVLQASESLNALSDIRLYKQHTVADYGISRI
jgi:hypothetical protein